MKAAAAFALALALSGCTTYVHKIEYVPLTSPIAGEVWMIQQDRYTLNDKLMICRVV